MKEHQIGVYLHSFRYVLCKKDRSSKRAFTEDTKPQTYRNCKQTFRCKASKAFHKPCLFTKADSGESDSDDTLKKLSKRKRGGPKTSVELLRKALDEALEREMDQPAKIKKDSGTNINININNNINTEK